MDLILLIFIVLIGLILCKMYIKNENFRMNYSNQNYLANPLDINDNTFNLKNDILSGYDSKNRGYNNLDYAINVAKDLQ